jgi:hypothetical protein
MHHCTAPADQPDQSTAVIKRGIKTPVSTHYTIAKTDLANQSEKVL